MYQLDYCRLPWRSCHQAKSVGHSEFDSTGNAVRQAVCRRPCPFCRTPDYKYQPDYTRRNAGGLRELLTGDEHVEALLDADITRMREQDAEVDDFRGHVGASQSRSSFYIEIKLGNPGQPLNIVVDTSLLLRDRDSLASVARINSELFAGLQILSTVGMEDTEMNRQACRQMLITVPTVCISGCILFEESLYQNTCDGKMLWIFWERIKSFVA